MLQIFFKFLFQEFMGGSDVDSLFQVSLALHDAIYALTAQHCQVGCQVMRRNFFF